MTEEKNMDEHDRQREGRPPEQQWWGWASPIGLGAGLFFVGAFFVLLALGLSILSSI